MEMLIMMVHVLAVGSVAAILEIVYIAPLYVCRSISNFTCVVMWGRCVVRLTLARIITMQ